MPADLSSSRWARSSASTSTKHLSPTRSSYVQQHHNRSLSPDKGQSSHVNASSFSSFNNNPNPSILTNGSTNTPTPGTSASASTSTSKPPLSKPEKDLLSRHNDLIKFTKLLRRLKWKGQTLLYCYHRVLDPESRTQNVIGDVSFPMSTATATAIDSGTEGNEAETMFKIDFFEFYVLLERVLVHLLGVVGVVVSAAYGDVKEGSADGLRTLSSSPSSQPHHDIGAGMGTDPPPPVLLRDQLLHRHALIGDSKMFHWQGQSNRHRFHANVLSALDYPDNPLHGILGTDPVRDYLGIAKEFRNRWKDVEEKRGVGGHGGAGDGGGDDDDALVGSRYEKILLDLRLDGMLACIVLAVEKAGEVARGELERFEIQVWDEIRRRRGGAGGGGGGGGGGGAEGDGDNGGGRDTVDGLREVMMMELDDFTARDHAPWEAMPDAMDWD